MKYYIITQSKSLSVSIFLLFCIFVLFFATKTSANHLTFTSSVEKFEISGNTPENLIDDFNDNSIAGTSNGAVTESGSILTIANSGIHNDILQSLWPITVDVSYLLLPNSFNIDDGSGNFVATSTWTQTTPDSAEFLALILSYPTSATTTEVIVTAFTDSPSIVTTVTGWTSGLVFSQAYINVDVSNPAEPSIISFTAEFSSVNINDVDGNIIMAQSFDDTTNNITSIVSSDAGVTLLSPFTAIDITSITGRGEWKVSAGALTL